MALAVTQKPNPDGFVKPGELIDIRAGAKLSLQDSRIFNLLIEHAWTEIGEDTTHKIPISRLRGPRHRGAERVADSVKTLMTTLVEVPVKLNGEDAVFATQLLGETTRMIDEDSAHAMLFYSFPKGLRRIIQDSRYWGRIKAYVMFSFTSKYALTLYEAICLRANLRVDQQRFTVEEFREMMGVEPGHYPQYPQLKQRVIDPALLEVNGLSDFTVELETERTGGLMRGPIKGFVLRWEKKSSEAWHQVLTEQLRPKVGRMARIKGKATPIAEATG